MKNEADPQLFPYEAPECCLECQHFHQPNPEEPKYVCLRTLKSIRHEIDLEFDCLGFEEICAVWEPVYVASHGVYV